MPRGKKLNITLEDVRYMPNYEAKKLLPVLVKRANQRITQLSQSGVEYGAIETAMKYVNKKGRSRFTQKGGREELYNVVKFLSAKTSTVTGVKELQQQQVNTTIKRYLEPTFIENMSEGEKERRRNEFADFLFSQEFQTARKYGKSEEMVETIANILDEDKNFIEIMHSFNEYLGTRITEEEIAERRARGFLK